MTAPPRYRLDDLRRLATAIGTAAGLTADRASALAASLLWYDALGAGSFGIETLPSWLERIENHAFDSQASGKVVAETMGTAVLNGENGIPVIVLARAGNLALEKARDAGVGLVRVTGIQAGGPAASIAADIAAGPFAAIFLGPGGAATIALPCADGPPAVFDSALGSGEAVPESGGDPRDSRVFPWTGLFPWLEAILPERDWLAVAVAVKVLEPLSSLHERVAATMRAAAEGPGRLLPHHSEVRRRDAREHGVPVGEAAWLRIQDWAHRFGVPLPSPVPVHRAAATTSTAS